MTELQSAKTYQAEVEFALAKARARLSQADFEIVSSGLIAEKKRLETLVSSLELKAFTGCSEVPLFPRIAQFAAKVVATWDIAGSSSIPTGTTCISEVSLTATGKDIYPSGYAPSFSAPFAVRL